MQQSISGRCDQESSRKEEKEKIKQHSVCSSTLAPHDLSRTQKRKTHKTPSSQRPRKSRLRTFQALLATDKDPFQDMKGGEKSQSNLSQFFIYLLQRPTPRPR